MRYRNKVKRTVIAPSFTFCGTLNPVGSKLDTSESIGNEYGVSKGSVVRLIRINKLTDELKALVDSGDIAIRTGVELSFLSEDTQAVVAECAEDWKIDMKNAKKLRASADSEGNITPFTLFFTARTPSRK